MVISDTVWEPKVRENISKIKQLKDKLKNLEINLVYPSVTTISDSEWGSWECKYYETKQELEWWRKVNEDPWKTITPEEVNSKVSKEKRQEMKVSVSDLLEEVVEKVVKEVGNFESYDSNVERKKGDNYHQRGHYFIFYKDGDMEHWLALYPMFEDQELANGHNHKTFILSFDKPVEKFIDVYTCIGCGAAKQGYANLHSNYDNSNSDNWDIIHKVPFNPWHEELTNVLEKEGKIHGSKGKGLGRTNHVWQGKEIKDKENKTFDKAEGFIPQEGTIQWKLKRNPQNEEKWAKERVSDCIDVLWEKEEFTSFRDKSVYQQKAMHLAMQECLREKEYKIEYFQSRDNINDWLETLTKKFEELINAKRVAYQSLEKWVKQILDISDDGKEIEDIKNKEFIILRNKPLIIREIWGQQVTRFIKEKKFEEFYSAQPQQENLVFFDVKEKIKKFYQETLDVLNLNQNVSQIEVLPK